MKKLIAFTGKKGHGKSTACDYIERTRSNQSPIRINFKDALVAEMRERFPDTLAALCQVNNLTSVDMLFKQKPFIMRELMQNYGTEVRRRDNSFYWTNLWQEAFDAHSNEIVLNDDTRFLNESRVVIQNEGIIIKVIREVSGEQVSTHVSETEMEQIKHDYVIKADTVDALEVELESILKEIGV